MKFTLFSIMTIIVIFILPSCQRESYVSYYNLVHEAEYNLINSNNDKAIELYEKGLSKVNKHYAKDLYNLAKAYSLMGDFNNSIKILKKIVNKKYPIGVPILMERDSYAFKNILLDKEFEEDLLYITIRDIQNRDLKSVEYIELQDTLSYFIDGDAYFRNQVMYFPNDSLGWENFYHSDYAKFQNQFLNYVKENGFPGYLKSGSLEGLLGPLLLHLSPKISKEIKPLLIDELHKGNISPYLLGEFLEKFEMAYEGKDCSSYYYIQRKCNEVNWKEIKESRLKIGGSIYYLLSWSRPRELKYFQPFPQTLHKD